MYASLGYNQSPNFSLPQTWLNGIPISIQIQNIIVYRLHSQFINLLSFTVITSLGSAPLMEISTMVQERLTHNPTVFMMRISNKYGTNLPSRPMTQGLGLAKEQPKKYKKLDRGLELIANGLDQQNTGFKFKPTVRLNLGLQGWVHSR